MSDPVDPMHPVGPSVGRASDRLVELASAVGSPTGVVRILSVLERALECSVWLHAPAAIVAASGLSEPSLGELRATRAFIEGTPSGDGDDEGVTVVYLAGSGPGAPPVHLVCGCAPELLDETAREVLNEAAGFMERHRALVAQRRIGRRAGGREFVERSESGDVGGPELEAWARALGIGRVGHVVAVVSQVTGATAADLEDVASGLEDLSDAAEVDHLVVVRDGEVCGLVLAGMDVDRAVACVERFQSLAGPLLERFGGAVGTASAITSQVTDAIRVIHDARRVCQLNRLIAPVRESVQAPAAETPVMIRLLGERRTELDALRSIMLDPLHDYDQRHGSELVKSLDVFLSNGCQWGVSAAALGVHVNTLRYRLARIEKCTGRDPASMAARVDFYIALRVDEAAREAAGSVPQRGPGSAPSRRPNLGASVEGRAASTIPGPAQR